eukprot:scaffold21566_cov73-Cyclotella_meneghiniana.AAC.7
MAPKSKRAKIENDADAIFSNSDPEELVTLSRNELIKEMKSGKKIHGFTDLDIAIKTKDVYGNGNVGEYFSMMRLDEVKVVNTNYRSTSIVAVAKEMTRHFSLEPLKVLPDCLDIFEPKRNEAGHIDFKIYFRRSLVLHDDVLLPFLSKLKKHLEEVQVCLGAVDGWVMCTPNNIEFLEETFGIKNIFDLSSMKNPCNCYDRRIHGRCNCKKSGKEYTIKTFDVPGTVVQSFNITREKDKAQLKRLLEFLSNA